MRMRLAPLVAVPLLFLAVACGSDSNTPVASGDPSTTTTTVPATSTTAMPTETCSTAGLRITLADQDLPAAVAAKRKAIFDAAVACDFDALGALAGPQFNYTFGDPSEGPAAYWKAQELAAVPAMRYLVQILDLPPVDRQLPDGGVRYRSWPSADQDVRTQADWDALKGVYSDEQVAAFQKDDLYTGYRVAITASGDWMYFVAGD